MESFHLLCVKGENIRIYSQTSETSKQLVEHIKEAVGIKLSGMKGVAANLVNKQLCSNWGITNVVD